MIVGFAAVIMVVLLVPRRLDLDRAPAPLSAGICFSALVLRALIAAFAAIFVLLYLPTTPLFTMVSHWCLDAVIPYVADHLAINGHTFGDAALVAPAVALALSALSVVFGVWRAARSVRALLASRKIGPGPRDSIVVEDGGLLVAVAGLRRPRVLISAGALVAFDDEELGASLEHEHGHIQRRHRFVLVAAEICRALARFVPGTAATISELRYHLERDADEYALRHRHEPTALASAICKAAAGQVGLVPQLSLAGGPVSRRVGRLLDGGPSASVRRVSALRLGLVTMSAAAVVGVAALPVAAADGIAVAQRGVTPHICDHS